MTALNDVGSDTLQVSVVAGAADGATPSSRTAGATVMALTSAADGSSGSFSQTTLSPSAEWVHGGSSGGFNWSYDLALPNAGVGGPMPAVGLQLAAPCLEVPHTTALPLGDGVWRVEVGIANTGWLPTHVSERARKDGRVLPITATIQSDVEVLGGTARVELGQLAGASSARFNAANDGTPDRVLATWIVRTARDRIDVTVSHQRAGCQTVSVALAN